MGFKRCNSWIGTILSQILVLIYETPVNPMITVLYDRKLLTLNFCKLGWSRTRQR